MKNHAMSIGSQVIHSHMNDKPFNYNEKGLCDIGLYSNKKNLLYGEDIQDIDFKKETYIKDDNLYIIDRSAQLHLGVKYIVLKDSNLNDEKISLLKKVIFFTTLALMFVTVIGYFLSKIFLRPISNEREKLDKFIKDTTHELNTPISALLMSTSMINCDDSKALSRIKLSANRISNIYEDLCYLLKDDIKKDKKILAIEVSDVVNEQLILLDGYIQSKRIKIEQDTDILIFKIDEESIKRLVNNILTNALKYSKPKGKVSITIKQNVLTIKDEGYGIKQKDLKNIKDRYYRANDSEGGFGIGLDIVNRICQNYNISLDIKSIENEGTTITLDFNGR